MTTRPSSSWTSAPRTPTSSSTRGHPVDPQPRRFGNDVTRAFMKKFRELRRANRSRCRSATQTGRRDLPRHRRLARRTGFRRAALAGYYKSQNAEAEFETPGVDNTFRLPGLTQFMADRLGYAIIALVELDRIEVDVLNRGQFLEDLQSLAVAMGLGMQGLGMSSASINLLPANCACRRC